MSAVHILGGELGRPVEVGREALSQLADVLTAAVPSC
jgi:hypothetical protein